MIKLMEITDTWTRIDNQMSTNDFMIQLRNEVGLELTSDISATKGLELEYLQTYKVLVANQTFARSRGKATKAFVYMDDVLVSSDTVTIDTSALAKEATLSSIDTKLTTTNSTLSDIATDVGTIESTSGDIKTNTDNLKTKADALKTSVDGIATTVSKLSPDITWTAVTGVNSNITAIEPIMFATKNNTMYLKGSFKCKDDRINVIGLDSEIKFFTTAGMTQIYTYLQESSGKLFTLELDGAISDINFLQNFEKNDVIYLNDIKFQLVS